MVACARAGEVEWDDPRCVDWFPNDFVTGRVLVVPALEDLCGKRRSDGIRRAVNKFEAFPLYFEKYGEEGSSSWCAEVAYERYPVAGIDAHGIPNLAPPHRIKRDNEYRGLVPKIPWDEEKRDCEGLITVEVLVRTGVRGRSREVHDARRTKVWKVASSMNEFVEIVTGVGAA